MIYPHTYSLVEDSHCYKFEDLRLSLNLCPAHYAVPEIEESFGVYLVDITRNGEKNKRLNFGKTASKILYEFISADPNKAIGFYPSDNHNSDHARIRMFAEWEKHVDTTQLVKFVNTVTVVDDQLTLVIYMHEKYSKQNELLTRFNEFAKAINAK